MLRLPRLLDAETLRERARLAPSALALEQRLNGISTARLTLPPGAERASLGDLAEFYTGDGDSAGIFRCCGVAQDAATGVQRSDWEHALAFLRDEVFPGLSAASAVSCGQAMAEALNAQATRRFVFGGADFAVSCEYDLDCSSVLSALLAIGGTLPGPWALGADFSSFPWTLRLKRLSDSPACELRVSRSLSSLRIGADTVGLATRVVPVGRAGLRLPEGYIDAASAADWGIRARVVRDGSIRRVSHLRAFGQAQLERLSQPRLTVTAEGRALFSLTGEALDRLRLGACCRVPLPEEGLTLTEHITGLSWPDLARTPERVKVTIASAREGIAETLWTLRGRGQDGSA